MSFSARMGFKPAKVNIQLGSMDDELRVSLWNIYYLAVIQRGEPRSQFEGSSPFHDFYIRLWAHYLKEPIDAMPVHYYELKATLKHYFNSCQWYEVYDLIEFTVRNLNRPYDEEFSALINPVLERELSGYRFISGQVVPISDENEVTSIESALSSTDVPRSAQVHLSLALEMLSSKTAPDYRNSIKESISAVESLAKSMTGDSQATLGAALGLIESQGKMHGALKKALSSLYGYASDESGIRHALLEESTLSFSDAKFMLVVCTAFVNYMIGKSAGA
ncbi:AbiJ-NTD4 domain-containing protein [Stenotrophomonas nematodicola]|uniref:AbiJ-NTD4 domain-containing protein n=1 Tax=Stenotrophomonas nematodicola TaxID=2656746 RepID=A0ABW7D1P0_9GAMM